MESGVGVVVVIILAFIAGQGGTITGYCVRVRVKLGSSCGGRNERTPENRPSTHSGE